MLDENRQCCSNCCSCCCCWTQSVGKCVCVRNSVAKGAYAFANADRYVIDYHSGMGRFLAMKAGKLATLGAGQPASRERENIEVRLENILN